jgi:hypothetical protein
MKAKKYRDDGLSVSVNDDSRIPDDYDSGKDFEALFCGNFDVFDLPSLISNDKEIRN